MNSKGEIVKTTGIRLDFRDIRDNYDRRISAMNIIEDQLEEMLRLFVNNVTSATTENDIYTLAIKHFPHNLEDESDEGNDMQVLQNAFIYVATEVTKRLRECDVTYEGAFPYIAFDFPESRESITFYNKRKPS